MDVALFPQDMITVVGMDRASRGLITAKDLGIKVEFSKFVNFSWQDSSGNIVAGQGGSQSSYKAKSSTSGGGQNNYHPYQR